MTNEIKKENRGTVLDCVELRLARRSRLFRKQRLYSVVLEEL